MIRIKLSGGLGNQLFQLSAAIACMKDENEVVYLECESIPFGGTNPNVRLELDKVSICRSHIESKVICEGKRRGELLSILPSLVSTKILKYSDHFRKRYEHSGFEVLEDKNDLRHLQRTGDNLRLDGYFNDFTFVELAYNRGLLSNRIGLKFSRRLKEIESYVRNLKENDLAMHVRLGDYRKLGTIFHRLDNQYYGAALEEIYDGKGRIVLFSNESNAVAGELVSISARKRCEIFRIPDLTSPETLFIMSKFTNIVCANSTFSMWASWLNSMSIPKKVVLPSPFMKWIPDRFVPDSWIKIQIK